MKCLDCPIELDEETAYSYFTKDGIQFHSRCKACFNAKTARANTSRRLENKLRAIAAKGGRCERCGYDRCVTALEFHHRDPDEKDEDICVLTKSSWERIASEIEKCDLLCANCHREVEEELREAMAI